LGSGEKLRLFVECPEVPVEIISFQLIFASLSDFEDVDHQTAVAMTRCLDWLAFKDPKKVAGHRLFF